MIGKSCMYRESDNELRGTSTLSVLEVYCAEG